MDNHFVEITDKQQILDMFYNPEWVDSCMAHAIPEGCILCQASDTHIDKLGVTNGWKEALLTQD